MVAWETKEVLSKGRVDHVLYSVHRKTPRLFRMERVTLASLIGLTYFYLDTDS